ncbi:MAG: acyl-CoA/acyl-ACP dehydrogenase [Actinobacteria bacterium]|nr:acyl-CoA/acyl-ACP dehydrogenase [Actinomycetota bacterium]MBV9254048.1 acyl-CoA/acyl-ACP dehydrogenase [Actinomycetota bacterium]
MDLDFTPEQELLGESVRGLCARHAGLDVVRQLENDPVGYPEKFWTQLVELGLTDLSQMSMLDIAIVYRELGRSLAPTPHFVSPFLSAFVLYVAGTEGQQEAWVSKLTDGEAIITPAWLEPDGGFGPAGVSAQFADGRVTGVKRHVAFAGAADRLLVLARDGAGGDIVYVLVDPKGPGVTLTQQQTISSDTQFRVDLDDAPGEVLARGGWDVWHEAMLEGCVLLAAQAAGGARAALELAVQYAKDRQQFDKPLGAFQAIAHYLADAVTTVDAAETLAYEAAWARDSGQSIERLAPMAKLFATKTFRDVTAMAQQVFGGVGFTVEYDIQLYFRRAKQLQISWWDTRYLEELVAASVLDS